MVSFSRHDFRLDEDFVAATLEAALGGSAIDLMVTYIKDKVFSFVVSCKEIGFHIVDSRSYACPQFKCYFHLWGNGGSNWWREFLIWKKECDAEWILVSPSKRRATLGMLAMHKPPVKSAIRSANPTRKRLSFATFQNYDVCKGYRYSATQNCLELASLSGYDLLPKEHVVIHPPPPVELQWMVASPSITFGTVVRRSSTASGKSDATAG